MVTLMKKKKRRGWIRGHNVKGKTYYYYCLTGPRNEAGEYPTKEEYLGTAERIREAVQNRYREK